VLVWQRGKCSFCSLQLWQALQLYSFLFFSLEQKLAVFAVAAALQG